MKQLLSTLFFLFAIVGCASSAEAGNTAVNTIYLPALQTANPTLRNDQMPLNMNYRSDGAIAVAYQDGGATIWQPDQNEIIGQWDIDVDGGYELLFVPNSELIVSKDSHHVQIWQEDGTLLHTLSSPRHVLMSVAVSPDGETVAWGEAGGGINVWHISNGTLLYRLESHSDHVMSLAYSPDGTMLVSGSADQTVLVWRLSDGTVEATYPHSDWIEDVTFTPDGLHIVSSAEDRSFNVWRVSDHSLHYSITPDVPIFGFDISSDSTKIVYAADGNIYIHNLTDGSLLAQGVIPYYYLQSPAFSPDGALLAATTYEFDNPIIIVWRVSDGALLHLASSNAVAPFAFSPDGRYLAYSVNTNDVNVVRVTP